MKILIAIHSYLGAGRAGGSETWATTTAAALRKMGHELMIADHRTPGPAHDFNPDLALTAHTTCAARFAWLECPKIHTCHGILPELEQPVRGFADVYVAVSEEVRDHMAAKGFGAHVIRNPIDTDHFRPVADTRPNPDRILFYTRYGQAARGVVAKAFRGRQVPMPSHTNQEGVPDLLNSADIVVGIGRSALEAMACGRNVIVYDYNGGDGFATTERLMEFRKNNCSGRRYGIRYTPDELRELAVENYDPDLGARLREYVIENHAPEKIARQYLDLIP